MTLVKHLKYSSLAALALAPVLRRRVVPFWLAAVFIDVDHIPGMIRRCGVNPIALVRFAFTFRLPPDREPVGFQMGRPLHHPAVTTGVLAVGIRHPVWLAAGLGMLFHLWLDRRDHENGLRLARGVTARQSGVCQGCGQRGTLLQGHHRDLRQCPPDHAVPLDDLIGLCDRCHDQAHRVAT